MKENYKKLLKKQIVNELTESEVYARLAELEKNEVNKKILKRISADEKSHAAIISRLVQIEGLPLFCLLFTCFCFWCSCYLFELAGQGFKFCL